MCWEKTTKDKKGQQRQTYQTCHETADHDCVAEDKIVICHRHDMTAAQAMCRKYGHHDAVMTKGAFLVTDYRVFKGPLGRSLRSFARSAYDIRTTHYICLLEPFTLFFLATPDLLACSTHVLARSLHSHKTVEIHEYIFTLKT